MGEKIYFTRPNKDQEANAEEVKSFEKSALSNFKRGNEVYIIEKFPRQFFQFSTKIKMEKITDPVPTLSPLSNSRLYRAVSTHSIYE